LSRVCIRVPIRTHRAIHARSASAVIERCFVRSAFQLKEDSLRAVQVNLRVILCVILPATSTTRDLQFWPRGEHPSAQLTRNAKKIDELWRPEFKMWFPKGKDDLAEVDSR